MDIFRRLKAYYEQDKWFFIGAFGFLALSTAVGLIQPYIVKYLIDDIIGQQKYDLVGPIALSIVGVVLIKATLQFLHGFCGGRLGNRSATRMRNKLYEKLNSLSYQYYDRAKTGDLMSRLTADLEGIRNFLGFGFPQLVNVFLMVGFGGTMMLIFNWKLTLITLIPIPLLILVAIKFEGKIHPIFRDMRKTMSQLTTAVQENITGVRTVKSYAREPHEVTKFTVQNSQFKTNQIDAATLWSRFFPLMEVIANSCVIILLVVGGYMVVNGTFSLGEFVAFFSLIWYIVGPLWGLGYHINVYTQFKASGERVLNLLAEPVFIKNKENAKRLNMDLVKGEVRFDNVTFNYPDKAPALKNISFYVPEGSVVGLLGPTGSGKSTIIQILMRAYDIKQGKITLDGVDIRDLDVFDLRTIISPVFQETFLFSASIRDNISYGIPNVTQEQIEHAAKLACAHDFIMETENGYDTIVGERGMGLSGGQKQRLAIARAFIKNPKILILDDATSAVDMETEHAIQASFKELMKGRTTFIIAHRISSLRFADEILVLQDGEIVQRGKHEQLVNEAGLYQETYKIQYADFPASVQTEASLAGIGGAKQNGEQ